MFDPKIDKNIVKLEDGIKTTQNFLEILANDGIQLTPIICGGKEKNHQIREQWTDGANYFDISPCIILGYEINHHTIKSLQHAGYKCIESTEVLKKEGFIIDYKVESKKSNAFELLVNLKYNLGSPVISTIERISKPGRRIFSSAQSLPKINNGLGIAIISTPKGVMTDIDARKQKLGGEIICKVF